MSAVASLRTSVPFDVLFRAGTQQYTTAPDEKEEPRHRRNPRKKEKVSTRILYHQNIDRIECGRHVSSRFLVTKSFRISDGDEGHRVAAVRSRFILFPSQVSSKRSSSPHLRNSYAREKVDSRVDSESSRTSLYVSNPCAIVPKSNSISNFTLIFFPG